MVSSPDFKESPCFFKLLAFAVILVLQLTLAEIGLCSEGPVKVTPLLLFSTAKKHVIYELCLEAFMQLPGMLSYLRKMDSRKEIGKAIQTRADPLLNLPASSFLV